MSTHDCPKCKKSTEFRHLHTPAYSDLPDTHMVGSERFECKECGHSITASMAKEFPLSCSSFHFILDSE